MSIIELRSIALKRQRLSVFAAKFAKFLTAMACLTAWTLVFVSIFTDDSTWLLLLSATISTAIATPIYTVASAYIKASIQNLTRPRL